MISFLRRLFTKRLAEDGSGAFPDELATAGADDDNSVASTEPLGDLATIQDVTLITPAFKALKVDWSGTDAAVIACVAELEDSQYAVLVKRGQQDSDIFRAVLARARQADKSERGVAIYTVAPVVLLTLVRERIGAKDLQGRSSGSGGRSAVRTGFHDLVAWGVRNDASDLHLHIDLNRPISKVSASIDGQYVTPANLSMPTERMQEMARVAWLDVRGGNGIIFDLAKEQQGRLYEVVDDRAYMLRWGSFIADAGPSITLRLLDLSARIEIQDLGNLGYMPSQVEQFERAQQSKGGAVVLGGVPGSGKTTSIGQLIVRLPKTRKVMTMEDPVEYEFEDALQASISRSLDGSGREAFQPKLMALKRSAPSDVFLGEIRDLVTGEAFQDITQSGSSCYATLHVGDCLGIPQRLGSSQIGIPFDVLGAPRFLKLLGYQALLPKLCACALPADSLLDGTTDSIGVHRGGEWWKIYLDRIERLYNFGLNRVQVRNPDGCEHCRRKGIRELFGYAGRTVAAELFEPGMDKDALRAISKGDELRLHEIFASHRHAAFDQPNMDGKNAMQCAVYKMSQGIIDPRDIEPNFVAFASLDKGRLT